MTVLLDSLVSTGHFSLHASRFFLDHFFPGLNSNGLELVIHIDIMASFIMKQMMGSQLDKVKGTARCHPENVSLCDGWLNQVFSPGWRNTVDWLLDTIEICFRLVFSRVSYQFFPSLCVLLVSAVHGSTHDNRREFEFPSLSLSPHVSFIARLSASHSSIILIPIVLVRVDVLVFYSKLHVLYVSRELIRWCSHPNELAMSLSFLKGGEGSKRKRLIERR